MSKPLGNRQPTDPAAPCEALCELLMTTGAHTHYDESVTQLEHALQTAALAEAAGSPPPLIVAALCHDIGHLLLHEHDHRHDFLDDDLQHEHVGARHLVPIFGPPVAGPVALHVTAKRYLVATDPHYAAHLTDASTRSLQLQGGPLSNADIARFLQQPYAQDAIQLRRWDDLGKEKGKPTPDLHHWRPTMRQLLRDAPAGRQPA